MNTFIGVVLALLLVLWGFITGASFMSDNYKVVTGMNSITLGENKKECEINLKRTETCHLVFIPKENS